MEKGSFDIEHTFDDNLFDGNFMGYSLSDQVAKEIKKLPLTAHQTSWDIGFSYERHKRKWAYNHLFSDSEDNLYLILEDRTLCRLSTESLDVLFRLTLPSQDKVPDEISLIAVHHYIFLSDGCGTLYILTNPKKNTKEMAQILMKDNSVLKGHPFRLLASQIVPNGCCRLLLESLVEDDRVERIQNKPLSFVAQGSSSISQPSSMSAERSSLSKSSYYYLLNYLEIDTTHWIISKSHLFKGKSQPRVAFFRTTEEAFALFSSSPFEIIQNPESAFDDSNFQEEIPKEPAEVDRSVYQKKIEEEEEALTGEDFQPTFIFYYQQGAMELYPCLKYRLSFHTHEMLSLNPTFFHSTDPQLVCHFGLSYDVDLALFSLIWKDDPQEPITIQHFETFDALAFIYKGKAQKKFLSVSPSCNHAVIAELKDFLYIYKKKQSIEHKSLHKVISLPTTGEDIIGLSVLSSGQLYLLTKNHFFSFQLE